MNNYQIKRVIEALDYLEHLSEWENEFIANIAAQRAREYELTEKQNHILNRISEK